MGRQALLERLTELLQNIYGEDKKNATSVTLCSGIILIYQRACVHACVRACVGAYVRAWCVRVCMAGLHNYSDTLTCPLKSIYK